MQNAGKSTLETFVGPEKGRLWQTGRFGNLFRAGVLGNRLGAFAYCVFGQFTRQQEPYGSLYFAGGDGRALVVMRQSRRFRSDSFEHIVYKAVHDTHGFAGDPGVRMYLLQYFVDVNSVTLLPLPLLFLIGLANILLSLAGLLYGLTARFRRHSRKIETTCRSVYDRASSMSTGKM